MLSVAGTLNYQAVSELNVPNAEERGAVRVTIPSDETDALGDDTYASRYPLTFSLSEIVNLALRKNLESLLDWVLHKAGAPDASIGGAGKQ